MAGISKRALVFVIATSGMTPLARAAEPPPVHYDIGLDVKQNDIESITVRASVRTVDDGIVDFEPPRQQPAEVHAERGQLDTTTPGRWRVTAAPATNVVLSWRSPKPEYQPAPHWTAWEKVVGRPDAAFVFGSALLAIPKGPDTRTATATLSLPPGWQVSSRLGETPLSVRYLKIASYLVSRDLYWATRQVDTTTTLRVGAIGMPPHDVDDAATLIVSSLRAIGDAATPEHAPRQVTLNLIRYEKGDGYGASTGGASATILLGANNTSRSWLFFVLRDIGEDENIQGDARDAWFTQGFNAYRVASALRASGDFDAIAFARHVDQTLDSYGGSPLRRASNARIVEDYDRIREMRDLPATRGELFAWLIDGRIRDATGGRKHLTDALRTMDARNPDRGAALIAAVATEGGGDITPLYRRYIVDGELLQLPPDTLGPCFAIGTVAYDYGWQVQHVFAKPAALCAAPVPLAADSVGAASAAIAGRDAIRR